MQLTKRALMQDVGERLKGTVQFEADALPYIEWERLQRRQGEARADDAASSSGARGQGRGGGRELSRVGGSPTAPSRR